MCLSLRIAFVPALAFFSFVNGICQEMHDLAGRWEYSSVRKINSGELVTGSELHKMVGEDAFYDLRKDHQYTSYIIGELTRGRWELSKDNTLTITLANGGSKTFELITLNRTTLVLLAAGEGYHTFIRHKHSIVSNDESNSVNQQESLLVKSEDIVKKWVLIEMHDSLEHQNVNDRMTSFVKGGWYDFRNDGVYVKKMVSDEKTGKWKLTEANRTLIMMDDDGFGSVWNIGYVSSSKLILYKPNSSMKHIFIPLQ